MSINVSFSSYSPPEPSKEAISLKIGIFFDGTLNNKNNTEERKNNSEDFKKNGTSKKTRYKLLQ